MYIEHPYKYDGKYYANVDGKMIEITKEVAYAMNNFAEAASQGRSKLNEKGERLNGNCGKSLLQRDEMDRIMNSLSRISRTIAVMSKTA